MLLSHVSLNAEFVTRRGATIVADVAIDTRSAAFMHDSIVLDQVVAASEEFLAWPAIETLVKVITKTLLEGHLAVLASVQRLEDSLDGEAEEGLLGC